MATLHGVERVTFGNGVPGYVCGSVKDPAVIVIQEWWGIVPTVVEHAVKLSQQGYRWVAGRCLPAVDRNLTSP
jgi:dienelactone hydrolase